MTKQRQRLGNKRKQVVAKGPFTPASPSKIDPRLAAALARGEVVRRQLATDEGGSISTAQAARLLGVSPSTVLRRWRRHRLVAWTDGRSLRVPVWQFDGMKLLRGIEESLQVFASKDQWRVLRYFLGKRRSLGHRRPLDLLPEGKVAEVIAHAQAHAQPEENSW